MEHMKKSIFWIIIIYETETTNVLYTGYHNLRMKSICVRCNMKNKNNKIREFAKNKGVYLWQIAERLGMSDANFSRKLRFEFSEKECEMVMNIISEIAEEDNE